MCKWFAVHTKLGTAQEKDDSTRERSCLNTELWLIYGASSEQVHSLRCSLISMSNIWFIEIMYLFTFILLASNNLLVWVLAQVPGGGLKLNVSLRALLEVPVWVSLLLVAEGTLHNHRQQLQFAYVCLSLHWAVCFSMVTIVVPQYHAFSSLVQPDARWAQFQPVKMQSAVMHSSGPWSGAPTQLPSPAISIVAPANDSHDSMALLHDQGHLLSLCTAPLSLASMPPITEGGSYHDDVIKLH